MNQFGNHSPMDHLLARLMGPVRKVRTLLFAHRDGQQKIIEDQLDETEIGPTGSIDTVISREAYFHDCGHYAENSNLGGRCECGAFICDRCIALCSACGSPTCPKHRVINPEDRSIYCPPCYEELIRVRRIGKITAAISSFFIERGDK